MPLRLWVTPAALFFFADALKLLDTCRDLDDQSSSFFSLPPLPSLFDVYVYTDIPGGSRRGLCGWLLPLAFLALIVFSFPFSAARALKLIGPFSSCGACSQNLNN